MSDCLRVVKLHDFPQLSKDCALLLNEEWPRSLTARLHSLQKSCDSLPLSLVLINKENKVLGHIRVKTEFNDTTSAFIESLIVEKSQRGKGYGKYIMRETEIFVKQIGFNRMTLTTTNQIGFYKSLGFVLNQTSDKLIEKHINIENISGINCLNSENPNNQLKEEPNCPPPPPPPPILVPFNKNQTIKVLMFKNI